MLFGVLNEEDECSSMSADLPSLDALREAVEQACQCTYAPKIVAGRHQVLAMPRAWVLEHMERVAVECLDLSDDWEFRRLIELAQLLDVELVRRLIPLGMGSTNPEVVEAAEDFKNL